MAVYLIHFDRKLTGHANHYLGYTDDEHYDTDHAVGTRLDYHMAGRGSKLMAAVARNGIPVRIARVWPKAPRSFERWLKRGRRNGRLCPTCAGPVALDRGKFNGQTPPPWEGK